MSNKKKTSKIKYECKNDKGVKDREVSLKRIESEAFQKRYDSCQWIMDSNGVPQLIKIQPIPTFAIKSQSDKLLKHLVSLYFKQVDPTQQFMALEQLPSVISKPSTLTYSMLALACRFATDKFGFNMVEVEENFVNQAKMLIPSQLVDSSFFHPTAVSSNRLMFDVIKGVTMLSMVETIRYKDVASLMLTDRAFRAFFTLGPENLKKIGLAGEVIWYILMSNLKYLAIVFGKWSMIRDISIGIERFSVIPTTRAILGLSRPISLPNPHLQSLVNSNIWPKEFIAACDFAYDFNFELLMLNNSQPLGLLHHSQQLIFKHRPFVTIIESELQAWYEKEVKFLDDPGGRQFLQDWALNRCTSCQLELYDVYFLYLLGIIHIHWPSMCLAMGPIQFPSESADAALRMAADLFYQMMATWVDIASHSYFRSPFSITVPSMTSIIFFNLYYRLPPSSAAAKILLGRINTIESWLRRELGWEDPQSALALIQEAKDIFLKPQTPLDPFSGNDI